MPAAEWPVTIPSDILFYLLYQFCKFCNFAKNRWMIVDVSSRSHWCQIYSSYLIKYAQIDLKNNPEQDFMVISLLYKRICQTSSLQRIYEYYRMCTMKFVNIWWTASKLLFDQNPLIIWVAAAETTIPSIILWHWVCCINYTKIWKVITWTRDRRKNRTQIIHNTNSTRM